MQPLPGSSAYRPSHHEPRTFQKTHLYDGLWRLITPVYLFAAGLVLAFGIVRGWDSARDFAEGSARAGQLLMAPWFLVLAAAFYLRRRGGFHDWHASDRGAEWNPSTHRADLKLLRLYQALVVVIAILILPAIPFSFI